MVNLSVERLNTTIIDSDVEKATVTHKVIFFIAFIVSLLLNIITCIFASRIAHLKPTWPNILSVQIVAFDLVTLMLGVTIAVVSFFIDDLLEEYPFLCKFQAVILNVWYIATLLFVLSITLDRMFAITFPFAYSKKIQSKHVMFSPIFALLAVLLFSLFLATLPLMLGNTFITLGPGVYCFWDAGDRDTLPVVVLNVTFIFIMLVTLAILTFQICLGIWKLVASKSVAPANQPKGPQSRGSDRTEVNFAKLAIVIALTSIISCLPFTATLIITASTDYNDSDIQYITMSFLLVTLLINPILHGLVRRPIRCGYHHLMKWIIYGLTCGTLNSKPTESFDEVLGLVRKPWQPPSDLTRQQQSQQPPAVSSTR